MIIALISILGLTILLKFAKPFLPFSVCPLCAGVSLTWLWLITAYFLGYQIELTIPAMLMGGSVVGIMFKLESVIKTKFVLRWKTIFVMSGFLAMNSLITGQWIIFASGIIMALVITLAFKLPKIKPEKPETEQSVEIKNKLKNCC